LNNPPPVRLFPPLIINSAIIEFT